jgi:hypothetical protein
MPKNIRLLLPAALVTLILLSCNILQVPGIEESAPTAAQTVVVVEITATPGVTDNDAQSTETPTIDLGPPPSFEEITFPEGIDPPEQRNGRWYLRDQPVALSYHLNTDGEKELWLTRESEPDWPIMIQSVDGTWVAGAEAWDGNVTFVNTNETPLNVTIYGIVEGGGTEELLSLELSPYEIYNLASLPPTDYVFGFQFMADEAFDLNCSVKLRQDSQLTFVSAPVGMAVSEASFQPQTGSDFDVTTSPLCGG